MFSTSFGVAVFLLLLMFASHLLLNLWTLSTLDAVAHDAATDVAVSGASAEELPAIQAEATSRAIAMLGSYGNDVQLSFTNVDPNQPVVVEVSGPSLSLLPQRFKELLGMDRFHRTITVEREVQRTP